MNDIPLCNLGTMRLSIAPSFVIETPRLILRVLDERDFDSWAAIMMNPQSAHFLAGPMSREQSWNSFATAIGHWQLRGFGFFSANLRTDDLRVGFVGPVFPLGWPGKEVGWQLRREYWGQGLAAEAARGVFQWVRKELRWTEVIHCIHPDNKNSIALATRLESRFLRTVKLPVGPPLESVEFHVYGQTFD